MSKTRSTQQDTPPAPVAHRVTRGLREGEIRTRAAANGAPASASFDAEAMTFDFTLLTSRSCKAWRYILDEGDRYPTYTQVEEKLDMRGAVGLDELVGSSILDSHRYWDIGSVKGVIEAAAVEGEDLVCRGRLSRRDDVADIARDIADGVIRSVSGGYDVLEESLTMRDGQVPLVTITKWRAREASLVPVPADPAARIRSGADPVSQTARIVPPPAGQRSEAAAAAVAATGAVAEVAIPATAVTDDAAVQAQAAVDAARSALAAAEAVLTKRAAPAPSVPAAPAAPAAPSPADAQRAADVQALRFMAQRKGETVLAEFDLVARTGGGIAELRTICTHALATSGGEISGTVNARSGAGASAAVPTVLKTRSEYAAMRAAAAR